MSSMQKYFSFTCETDCGLPSVTLLGRKSDWEKMLLRLERLKTFGEEPTVWYGLLKPVFERFVRTFEEGESQEMKDFWQRIAQSWNGGSGPTFLSGGFASARLRRFGSLLTFCPRLDHGILFLG